MRDIIADVRWILAESREYQKDVYLCFIDYAKAFDCVDHNKLWITLQRMGIPEHLIVLIRTLYIDQEAVFQTEQEDT
ncbi:reverse transcriptase domain-containing protein, partial [Pseudomonas sp. MOB-449]|nr:reverse transcriptase domain-containing protein [Pseudomonas sp. MOB-449]